VALYGDALVVGSRSPNREPAMRVAGYMSRSIVSRGEGRKGDRRVDILVEGRLVAKLGGVEGIGGDGLSL